MSARRIPAAPHAFPAPSSSAFEPRHHHQQQQSSSAPAPPPPPCHDASPPAAARPSLLHPSKRRDREWDEYRADRPPRVSPPASPVRLNDGEVLLPTNSPATNATRSACAAAVVVPSPQQQPHHFAVISQDVDYNLEDDGGTDDVDVDMDMDDYTGQPPPKRHRTDDWGSYSGIVNDDIGNSNSNSTDGRNNNSNTGASSSSVRVLASPPAGPGAASASASSAAAAAAAPVEWWKQKKPHKKTDEEIGRGYGSAVGKKVVNKNHQDTSSSSAGTLRCHVCRVVVPASEGTPKDSGSSAPMTSSASGAAAAAAAALLPPRPPAQKNSLLSYFPPQGGKARSTSCPTSPPNHHVSNNAPGAAPSFSSTCKTAAAAAGEATTAAQPSHSTRHLSPCAYCERPACNSGCSRQCESCLGSYCTFCSTVNYGGRVERTLCLDCDSAAASAAAAVAAGTVDTNAGGGGGGEHDVDMMDL